MHQYHISVSNVSTSKPTLKYTQWKVGTLGGPRGKSPTNITSASCGVFLVQGNQQSHTQWTARFRWQHGLYGVRCQLSVSQFHNIRAFNSKHRQDLGLKLYRILE